LSWQNHKLCATLICCLGLWGCDPGNVLPTEEPEATGAEETAGIKTGEVDGASDSSDIDAEDTGTDFTGAGVTENDGTDSDDDEYQAIRNAVANLQGPSGYKITFIVKQSVFLNASTFTITNTTKELDGDPPITVLSGVPFTIGLAVDNSYRIVQQSTDTWYIELYSDNSAFDSKLFDNLNTFKIYFDDQGSPSYVMTGKINGS